MAQTGMEGMVRSGGCATFPDMTRLLSTALDMLARLPDDRQDAMAQIILDELADQQRWDDAFARSQDLLATLADEALEEIRRGDVLDTDPGSKHS